MFLNSLDREIFIFIKKLFLLEKFFMIGVIRIIISIIQLLFRKKLQGSNMENKLVIILAKFLEVLFF